MTSWKVAVPLLATLALACGGESPSTPTPPATPPPAHDGSWAGTTSDGLPVSFTVHQNVVTRLSLGLRFSFNIAGVAVTCDKTLEGAPNALVESNGVRFAINGGGMQTTITGTFESPSRASGTYGAVSVTNFSCGLAQLSGGSFLRGAQTFTAAKQ